MKEYFLILIGVCLISGFASMLAPEGGLSPSLNFVTALCVMSVIISPISSIVGELSSGELDFFERFGERYEDVDVFEEIYNENITKESILTAERTLASMACRELSIDEEDIDISIETKNEDGELRVSYVKVYISGGAIFKDPRAISEYISGLVLCECEIIYGTEGI